MSSTRVYALALTLWLLLPAMGRAGQIQMPVNTNTSTLSVTLQLNLPILGTRSDTDTTPVDGFVVVALDNNGLPTHVALRNFDLRAMRDLNLNLDWGFFGGRLDATATGLRLYHGEPGPQNPFFPITGAQFVASNVPYAAVGVANYHASGTVCSLLSGAGQPCDGNFDLSQQGTNTFDQMPGSIVVSNGIAYLHAELAFTNYLDETNPDLGTMTGRAVVNAAAPVPPGLVPFGSEWRYLDDGSDPGPAWKESDFDDTSWQLGTAQFGYGDGDEVTTNSFGPDPNNKFITYYYRHQFGVANPALYTNLVLRLVRDDGAIVYLNDAEIFRSNMPTGAVNRLTPALTAVGGAEESLPFATNVPPWLLLPGINTIAVEVHQNAPTSSDLSFDLELEGNTLLNNLLPAVTITNPPDGAIVSGDSFEIGAAASDPDGVVTVVEFFVNDVKVGEDFTSPYSVVVPRRCPGRYTLTARAWDNNWQFGLSSAVTVSVARASSVLVPPGAPWRYLDNGTDQGTAWRAPGFNDAAWPVGRAQFGYGDGDEMTTNSFGPDPNNKFVTYYYRHRFVVGDPAALVGMILRVLRDDGAVVYLNGAEIFRSNMPTGAINSATLAVGTVGGTDETNFFTTTLGTNGLVPGTNVLAVEVHQATTNSSDLSFDLELLGAGVAAGPLVQITSPTNGTAAPPGVPIPVSVQATSPGGVVTRVELYDGPNKLGEATTPPFDFTWTGAAAGLHLLTARAQDDCGGTSTSAVAQVAVGLHALVPQGVVWKYSDHNLDPGPAWRSAGYDDGWWSNGVAPFGFGDGDEVTLVRSNRQPTTYFRRVWTVPDRSVITNLTVRLVRDDGAVVWLNGIEIFRSNMPQGPVSHTTPASSAVSGADESAWYSTNVPVALLQNGLNVLAVEVHQRTVDSPDLSFDLQLEAHVRAATPAASARASEDQHTIRWPSWAVGYRLYRTDRLTPPVQWQMVPLPVQDDGGWKWVTLPPGASNEFYRLGW